MKRLNPLILLLIPCVISAQNITVTYTGSRNNPKFQQASVFYTGSGSVDTSQSMMYTSSSASSLLRFDLDDLPPNAIINSAYLYLYGVTTADKSWKTAPLSEVYDGSSGHYSQAGMIKNVLQAWSPSTLTFNNRPAADNTEGAFPYLPLPPGSWGNYKLNITNYVKGWVSTPSSNHGVQLEFNYMNEREWTSMNFYSGQAIPELQPRLVITYQVPEPTPVCMSTLTLRGNLTDGKYKQINYRSAPGVNDSSGARIEASLLYDWNGDSDPYPCRAIMRYDVSAIPAGSTVTKARLFLYPTDGNPIYPGIATMGAGNSLLERVVQPWSASALHPLLNPAVVSTANRKTLPFTDEWWQSYEVDVKEFVQSWVNAPDSNYGMQLRLQNEWPDEMFMMFHSAQSDASLQPRLEICYMPTFNPLDTCTIRFTDSIIPYDRKAHLFHPVTSNNNAKLPVRMCWTFGDGVDSCVYYDSTHPYTGAPMQHRYPNEYFNYPVCVTAVYGDSCTASYCAQSEKASYCTASFQDSVYLSNGLRHKFTPAVTNTQNKKPVYICWSFGDGSTECIHYDSAHPYTAEPVVHTYPVSSDYRVCLSVQYDDSCSASSCDYIKASFCDHTGLITRLNTTDGRYKQAVISNTTPTVADTSNTEIIAEAWYNQTYRYYRTALRYDVSWLPSNAVVMGARLYFSPNMSSTNGYPGSPIYNYVNTNFAAVFSHIKTPWTPATISWNNQPAIDTMGQAMLFAYTYTQGADITRLVRYWKEKPDSNFGVLFRMSPEAPNTSFIFRSPLAPDSLQPRLEICYYLSDSACSASFTDSLVTTARATHCFRPTLTNAGAKAPVRICWTFGDGRDTCVYYSAEHPYTGMPFYHTYPDMYNSYLVRMNILYEDSCFASFVLQTQRASKCAVSIYDLQPGYGANHIFSQETSNDLLTKLSTICWSFGDGTDSCLTYNAAAPHATDTMPHSYAANALYQPCVTVAYQDGCAASACRYANYVNCDSNKLVIRGNRTNGKYSQLVKDQYYPYVSDTTQREFIAFHAFLYSVGKEYITRTQFRYDLSEIPDSAIVMDARLYLHKKDTSYTAIYPDYGVLCCFQGRIEAAYDASRVVGFSRIDSVINMTPLVQYWVSNPAANRGAVFHVYPEERESGISAITYHSGQAPDSLQPRLEICYALPYRPAGQARMMTAATQAPPAASAIQAWLYPNPATNMLNIRVQSSQAQAGAIYLYDMQGRMVQVLQQHTQYNKGNNLIHVPVDRRHAAPGLYLVKIQAGAGSYTYKVVLK